MFHIDIRTIHFTLETNATFVETRSSFVLNAIKIYLLGLNPNISSSLVHVSRCKAPFTEYIFGFKGQIPLSANAMAANVWQAMLNVEGMFCIRVLLIQTVPSEQSTFSVVKLI
jgi:hypothetical protein